MKKVPDPAGQKSQDPTGSGSSSLNISVMVQDEEGRNRTKLKVENTIRWRAVEDEDKNVVRQSNARVVKWSDGSLSLHLGRSIWQLSSKTVYE